jgi:starvation-inducible DNA-binding protein
MDEFAEQMKVALADTFAFYLKTHNFHWNVEGPNFTEYHAFLNTLYNEVWIAVDVIAEHIRTIDVYVPGSFIRFKDLATIQDETNIPSALAMMVKLEEDNRKVITSLTKAQLLAEKNKKIGIANFLQDRIDIHEKHGWMLRSIVKAK